MKKTLQEPLVHFILLSLTIFVIYQWIASYNHRTAQTVVVSQAEIERLVSLYVAETGVLPSDANMTAVLRNHIQNEVLAREARKLGMAEEDTIVKRRLAQKMTFMLSDLEQIETPNDNVLVAWFEENVSKFKVPLRLSFDHVFFSDGQDSRIAKALEDLRVNPTGDWPGKGDPFMLQRQYVSQSMPEVLRVFGEQFCIGLSELAATEDGLWQGPLRSAFGSHLVRITDRSSERTPSFREVRSRVLQDWREAERRRRTAQNIEAIVSKYDVIIEGAKNQ